MLLLPFKVDQKFVKILNVREGSEKTYNYSSCAKDFIHFCAYADECLLKNEEQNVYEENWTVPYFIFIMANENTPKNCNYPGF